MFHTATCISDVAGGNIHMIKQTVAASPAKDWSPTELMMGSFVLKNWRENNPHEVFI